jgi:YggT family protein
MDIRDIIITFISLLGTALSFAIIIRALISWIMPAEGSGFSRVLVDVTEPILAPIRRALPPTGMLDLSPLIVLIVLSVLWRLV